jgi:undecaprenyl diphosphate synthase
MTEFSSALVEIRKLAPEATRRKDASAALHVAIIMDGNGRWAEARGVPRTMGHYHGAEAVRGAVKAAVRSGATHLTLFGFSSETWKQPKSEVAYLMGMLRNYLRRDVQELHEAGIRLSVIGERAALPSDIVALIDDAERLTRDNARLHLTIALNYGGRSDIVAASRRLAACVAAGMLDPEDIGESAFAAHLSTAALPGSRPHDPHQRRAARQQLPALAARLCRDGLCREILARLHRREPDRGLGGVPPPRQTVRRNRTRRLAGRRYPDIGVHT